MSVDSSESDRIICYFLFVILYLQNIQLPIESVPLAGSSVIRLKNRQKALHGSGARGSDTGSTGYLFLFSFSPSACVTSTPLQPWRRSCPRWQNSPRKWWDCRLQLGTYETGLELQRRSWQAREAARMATVQVLATESSTISTCGRANSKMVVYGLSGRRA